MLPPKRIALCIFSLLFVLMLNSAAAQSSNIVRVATDLQNPRGIAVLPDGRLLVAQAGTGFIPDDPQDYTGKLSILEDLNGDGDFDDEGEITDVIDKLPGYNIMYQFNPGRDEIVGIGDVIALDDGRVFFTLDNNFEVLSIVELNSEFEIMGNLIERPGSMNAIAYDNQADVIYVVESTLNALSSVTLDGEFETIVYFGALAHLQQPVPAGLAIDPHTGDLLVALFSGQLWDYYGETLSYMPGDAKIVRVNPQTGEYTDEVNGLTAAVDVAVDEMGNIFVAELTTQWPTPVLYREFDLYDPASPPDPGGYARFTGRITMYPVDGGDPVILADNLDQPTNITYHNGYIYVSVGLGTPGRTVWSESGLTSIIGEVYKVSIAG